MYLSIQNRCKTTGPGNEWWGSIVKILWARGLHFFLQPVVRDSSLVFVYFLRWNILCPTMDIYYFKFNSVFIFTQKRKKLKLRQGSFYPLESPVIVTRHRYYMHRAIEQLTYICSTYVPPHIKTAVILLEYRIQNRNQNEVMRIIGRLCISRK